MIGDLLKELSVALWRYFRYHLARLTGLHRASIPQATETPRATSAVVEGGEMAPPPDETMLSAAYTRTVR